MPVQIDPLIAVAVMAATACTDAVYVMFTNAVVKRKRLPAASWSSIWYLLSSFAVISYTNHWVLCCSRRLVPSSALMRPSPSCIPVRPIRRHRPAPRRSDAHARG